MCYISGSFLFAYRIDDIDYISAAQNVATVIASLVVVVINASSMRVLCHVVYVLCQVDNL